MKFILASTSPRRKDLLAQAGFSFTVTAADIDETPHPKEAPRDFCLRMAIEKAEVVAKKHVSETCLILAADTIVVIDDQILGKPKDENDAKTMLKKLSAKTHHVMTAYAFAFTHPPQIRTGLETTAVTFRSLSDKEILEYIQSREPFDKAGAYAIQGKARDFVTDITGSLTNVVGLPVEKIEEFLNDHLVKSDD
jgi:septum formation protein